MTNLDHYMPDLLQWAKEGATYAEMRRWLLECGEDVPLSSLWAAMRLAGARSRRAPMRRPRGVVPWPRMPNPRHLGWLRAYRADPPVPIADIARAAGVSKQAVHGALKKLVSQGADDYIVSP